MLRQCYFTALFCSAVRGPGDVPPQCCQAAAARQRVPVPSLAPPCTLCTSHLTPPYPRSCAASQLPGEPGVGDEALAARVDALVKAHLLHVTSHMVALQSALASAGGGS